jgi:hypothetical protein
MKQIEAVKHLIVKITPSLPSQSSRGRAAKLSRKIEQGLERSHLY